MKNYADTAADWYLKRTDNAEAVLEQHPEIRQIYEGCRADIERVLAETEYFHGSGSHQYVKGEEKPVDKLSPILKAGLVPHDDLLSETFVGRKIPSVSMCQQRQYARVYADLAMPEGQKLDYEYGSRRFWWWYFGAKMDVASKLEVLKDPKKRKLAIINIWNLYISKLFVQRNLSPKWSSAKNIWNNSVYRLLASHPDWDKMLKSKGQEPSQDFEEEATTWLDRYVRPKRKGSKKSLWKMKWRTIMLNEKSTIPDNTPLLLGIKKGAVQPLQLKNKAVAMYEVRTDKPVTPDQFSYVEAPLANIEAVRKQITEAGLSFPVIPMECMEHHMREQSFSELTAPHEV